MLRRIVPGLTALVGTLVLLLGSVLAAPNAQEIDLAQRATRTPRPTLTPTEPRINFEATPTERRIFLQPTGITFEDFLLYYNANNGVLAVGMLNREREHVTLTAINASLGWTNIQSDGLDRLIFYQAGTGMGVMGSVDGMGNYYDRDFYEPGTLYDAWTHLADSDEGRILFYSAPDGSTAITDTDENGNLITHTMFTLAPGWTHISGAKEGLVFYNSTDGSLEFGRLNADYSYSKIEQYPAQVFPAGYTHIVNNATLTLFYNEFDGTSEVGEFAADGSYQLLRVQPLQPNWTHIAGIENSDGLAGYFLFYNTYTGAGEIAYIDPVTGEYQQVVAYADGFFSTGWTHIVPVRPN